MAGVTNKRGEVEKGAEPMRACSQLGGRFNEGGGAKKGAWLGKGVGLQRGRGQRGDVANQKGVGALRGRGQ